MVLPSSDDVSRLTETETNTYLTSLAICREVCPPERRSEPRYATDTPATVIVLAPRRSAAVPARVIDVGRNGIGLRVSQPLAIDSRVQIAMESVDIIGRILWTRNQEAGLQIEDVRVRKPAA